MVLSLTAEQEAVVLDSARHDGKTPEQLLTEMALWLPLVQREESEQRLIEERILAADNCVTWITEDEMDARVRKMLER
jgi:hypothetical protein